MHVFPHRRAKGRGGSPYLELHVHTIRRIGIRQLGSRLGGKKKKEKKKKKKKRRILRRIGGCRDKFGIFSILWLRTLWFSKALLFEGRVSDSGDASDSELLVQSSEAAGQNMIQVRSCICQLGSGNCHVIFKIQGSCM